MGTVILIEWPNNESLDINRFVPMGEIFGNKCYHHYQRIRLWTASGLDYEVLWRKCWLGIRIADKIGD